MRYTYRGHEAAIEWPLSCGDLRSTHATSQESLQATSSSQGTIESPQYALNSQHNCDQFDEKVQFGGHGPLGLLILVLFEMLLLPEAHQKEGHQVQLGKAG